MAETLQALPQALEQGTLRGIFDRLSRATVKQIHDSPFMTVLVVTGGGSQAIAWLLGVAGASRTVLEAIVPYGHHALIEFLGYEPEKCVSVETAKAMAARARERALWLRQDDGPVVGLACTAAIVTDRPKRGEHRACIAVADRSGMTTYSLHLAKGKRDRAGEEELVSRVIIHALATSCGIDDEFSPTLDSNEVLEVVCEDSPDLLQRLIDGTVQTVTVHRDGRMVADEPSQAAILSGSFNPLHGGHRELARVASQILCREVVFELSVINVDKPPLDYDEVVRRVQQIVGWSSIILTRAPLFREKARLFPGCVFVIGCDTADRLLDARYYGGQESAMREALAEIRWLGCRFVVAGRVKDGVFRTLADVAVPDEFRTMFEAIPEAAFRVDISSTDIRAA